MGLVSEGWFLLKALPPYPDRLYAVEPVNDLQPHQSFSTGCPCQPRSRKVWGGVQIVHNAFDGRELVEQHGVN